MTDRTSVATSTSFQCTCALGQLRRAARPGPALHVSRWRATVSETSPTTTTCRRTAQLCFRSVQASFMSHVPTVAIALPSNAIQVFVVNFLQSAYNISRYLSSCYRRLFMQLGWVIEAAQCHLLAQTWKLMCDALSRCVSSRSFSSVGKTTKLGFKYCSLYSQNVIITDLLVVSTPTYFSYLLESVLPEACCFFVLFFSNRTPST